jgi:hypothetical protein
MVTLGWFLMIPPGHLAPQPHSKKKLRVPDATAPLSGWYPVETFTTETLCRETLRDLSTPSPSRTAFLKQHRDPREHQYFVKALPMGQCIATDDPRVKGTR